MANSKYINDSKGVNQFIENLGGDFSILVHEIRKTILGADNSIDEYIKWNSPAFFYNGDMKPFDPKEYKRDLIVIHCRKNTALLVFPTGERIQDKWDILEGDYSDGRRMITFKNISEVHTKRNELQSIIKEWLQGIET